MKVYIVETYVEYDIESPSFIDKIFKSVDKAKEYAREKNIIEEDKDPYEKLVYYINREKGIEVEE